MNANNNDLKLLRELSEIKQPHGFVSLAPTIHVTIPNLCNNGFDVDAIVARITKCLEDEIASSVKSVLVPDAGKLDSYEIQIVVAELLGVLKKRELSIEEAERILDEAKAELKHARLVGDQQAISAQL